MEDDVEENEGIEPPPHLPFGTVPVPTNAAGRPSKFKRSILKTVKRLASIGLTELEISFVIEIDEVTLWRWKTRYPQIRKALIPGLRIANKRVEASLYHRAIGYSHADVHVTSYEGQVTLTPIMRHYPPSEGAAKMWLTNRDPPRRKARKGPELSPPRGRPLESAAALPAESDALAAYQGRLEAIAAGRRANTRLAGRMVTNGHSGNGPRRGEDAGEG